MFSLPVWLLITRSLLHDDLKCFPLQEELVKNLYLQRLVLEKSRHKLSLWFGIISTFLGVTGFVFSYLCPEISPKIWSGKTDYLLRKVLQNAFLNSLY